MTPSELAQVIQRNYIDNNSELIYCLERLVNGMLISQSKRMGFKSRHCLWRFLLHLHPHHSTPL